MRKTQYVMALQLLIAIAGCQSSQPGSAPAPVAAAATPPSRAVAPANPVAPAPTAAPFNLTGKVVAFDKPLAGAAIAVYVLGSTSPLVSGTAADDGSFSVLVPGEQLTTIYKVVAVKSGQALTNLFRPGDASQPGSYRVASDPLSFVVLNASTTLAYELVASRLEATGQLQSAVPAAAQAAFTAFAGLIAAETGLVASGTPQAATVLSALNNLGLLESNADAIGNLGLGATVAQQMAFSRAANAIGQALRDAQSAPGAPAVNPSLLGNIGFGPVTAPGVATPSVASSSGSSYGGGSGPAAISAGVTIVAPTAGGFQAPQGAVSNALITTGGIVATFPVGLQPEGATFDPAGNLWVANLGDSTVTKLSASGVNLGTYATGDSQTGGVATDAAGNAWATNYGSASVTKFSPAGVKLGRVSVGRNPHDIRFDGNGHMWVSNSGDQSVSELSTTDGSLIKLWGVSATPYGLDFDASGQIWVANFGSWNVSTIPVVGTTVVATQIGITNANPCAVAIDRRPNAGGNIWVADQGTGQVTEFDANRNILRNVTVGRQPFGITVDENGNVWVTNLGSDSLTELSPAGAVLGTFPLGAGTKPFAPVADGRGHIWVTEFGAKSVVEVLN